MFKTRKLFRVRLFLPAAKEEIQNKEIERTNTNNILFKP